MLVRASNGSGGGGGGNKAELLWENNNPSATFTASYPLADIQATAASDNWGAKYDALLVHSKNFYNTTAGQSITVIIKGMDYTGSNWANKVFGNTYNTTFKYNTDGTINATYAASSGNCPPLKIYGINLGITP